MFRVWIFFSTKSSPFQLLEKVYIPRSFTLYLKTLKKRNDLFAKKETVEIFSGNTFFNLMMIWIATFLNIIFMGILIFSLCIFSVLCVTYGNISRYTCPCPCMWKVEDDFVFLSLFLLPYSPTTGPGAHGWS